MRGRNNIDRFLSPASVEAFEQECAMARAEGRFPVGTLRIYPRHTARTLAGGCTLYSIVRLEDGVRSFPAIRAPFKR